MQLPLQLRQRVTLWATKIEALAPADPRRPALLAQARADLDQLCLRLARPWAVGAGAGLAGLCGAGILLLASRPRPAPLVTDLLMQPPALALLALLGVMVWHGVEGRLTRDLRAGADILFENMGRPMF